MQGFARSNFTRGTIASRNQDGSSNAFAITSSVSLLAGSPNVKGDYTELLASLATDAYGFWTSVSNTFASGALRNVYIDIAVGDAGSESIVVSNLAGGSATQDGRQYYFTGLSLPTGTRLSARISSNFSGHTAGLTVFVDPVLRTEKSETAYVSYGSNASSTVGTLVTAAIIPANGAWTNVGTTTREHKMWALGMDQGLDASLNAETFNVQVGYGADVNSVVMFINKFLFVTGGAETIQGPIPPCAFATVSSGQQLWVRMNATNAEARGITIYGN